MSRRFLYIYLAFVLTLASCGKEAEDILPDYLYGTWKITNGDTLTLSRVNGVNIANCDLNYGPVRKRSDYPFTYRNEKLGIKGGLGSYLANGDYNFFESFRWIQRGQSFEILKYQWFPLSSSLGDYYTFTKIP